MEQQQSTNKWGREEQ